MTTIFPNKTLWRLDQDDEIWTKNERTYTGLPSLTPYVGRQRIYTEMAMKGWTQEPTVSVRLRLLHRENGTVRDAGMWPQRTAVRSTTHEETNAKGLSNTERDLRWHAEPRGRGFSCGFHIHGFGTQARPISSNVTSILFLVKHHQLLNGQFSGIY